MHIGRERFREAAQPGTRQLAGHPTNDLAHEMTVRVGVVDVPRTGFEPRVGGGKCVGHPLPVPEIVVGESLADRRHTGAVAERFADGGALLAAGGELGPHRSDRIVETDRAVIDELQRQQGDDGLADGVEVHQRVATPELRARLIGPAADKIDHCLAAHHHAHCCTHFAALEEVAFEGVAHARVPGVAVPADRSVHRQILADTCTCWHCGCGVFRDAHRCRGER